MNSIVLLDTALTLTHTPLKSKCWLADCYWLEVLVSWRSWLASISLQVVHTHYISRISCQSGGKSAGISDFSETTFYFSMFESLILLTSAMEYLHSVLAKVRSFQSCRSMCIAFMFPSKYPEIFLQGWCGGSSFPVFSSQWKSSLRSLPSANLTTCLAQRIWLDTQHCFNDPAIRPFENNSVWSQWAVAACLSSTFGKIVQKNLGIQRAIP